MLDERRLARADVAGDDDEALALRQAEPEIRHGFLVRSAFEVKARVRRQLKRGRAQAVMVGVHRRGSPTRVQKLYRRPSNADATVLSKPLPEVL